jgi:NAD(P)-dependent dehydrogenase (short-subunit alcohol dehydrogenase family)
VDGGDAECDPAQAMLWGLGRSAALEHPRDWGGLVDLPRDPDDDDLAALCAAPSAGGGEDQLAVRRGGLLACRVVRAEAGPGPGREPGPETGPGPETPWRPHGTVLVTGGTGALGARAARWLAAHGAGRLVLTGRRGPDAPDAGRLVAELDGLGARATVVACDMADRAAVAELVASLRSLPDGERLTAVVHAAGVSGGLTPLGELDAAGFTEVLAGKAVGAAHLDELLGDTPLEAFVMFSSVAGVWGSGGQAAYAAGNAFLDALAHRRRARGLPATSVAFGPWAGAGMAADPALRDRLRERGLRPLPPSAALTALWQAVAAGETALTIADVDWRTFLPLFTGARAARLFDDLTPADEDTGPQDPGPVSAAARLLALPAEERPAALLELVRTEAAAVAGCPSPEDIDPHRRFLELGFDSVASVELGRRLVRATGLALPTPVVFEHPTAAELAEHLAGELASGEPPAVAAPTEPSGLRDLYRHACLTGRLTEGLELLKAAARLRPRFTAHDTATEAVPAIVRLAAGPAAPALVCLPSIIAPSGANSFARLAQHLDGLRDLYALPHPGFGDGEPLPATAEALIDLHALALAEHFGGTPVALAGYSAGGWLAHAVAARMEEIGAGPAAVVLLDTLHPGQQVAEESVKRQISRIAASDQAFALMTDAQLTAQGTYIDLLKGWAPGPLTAPVLVLRSAEGIPRDVRVDDTHNLACRPSWGPGHETLDVAGDHQSIMNEDARSTAEALHRRLARL